MIDDALDWTDEGRAALAEEKTWGVALRRGATREELLADLDKGFARYLPCWRRGLAKSAPIAHAVLARVDAGWTSADLSVDEAAGLISLLGARSEGHDVALIELVLRDRGAAFTIAALVRAWSLVTDYADPDWPKSEARLDIYLREIDATSSSAQDCSVSYAKGHFADYLCKRQRAHPSAELVAAIAVAWDAAPLHARPALALASAETAWAERAVREILDARPAWHPHHAWRALPQLVRDPELLDRIGFTEHGQLTHAILEHLGATAALPIYERRWATRLGGQRTRLAEQLVNIRGPRTARLLAQYAEKAPVAALVRAYFARHGELFAEIRHDPALAKHAAQLDKLAAKLAPKPKRTTAARRTSRP